MIWLGFSLSEARLKNPNAERRWSRSLAYWICVTSVASVHKLAKAWACFVTLSQRLFCHFAIWPSFSPSEARLKNPNAERRWSRSLAFWICEASEASIDKLTKARGCFEGSRECILSCEKTNPWQIVTQNMTIYNFWMLTIWHDTLWPKYSAMILVGF